MSMKSALYARPYVRNLLGLAILSALAAAPVAAQEAAASGNKEAKTLQTITVTGSRATVARSPE